MMFARPSKLDVMLMGALALAEIVIGTWGLPGNGWAWASGPFGTALLAITWIFLRPGWVKIGHSRGRRETLGYAREARRFNLTLTEWLDAELDRDIATIDPKRWEKLRNS